MEIIEISKLLAYAVGYSHENNSYYIYMGWLPDSSGDGSNRILNQLISELLGESSANVVLVPSLARALELMPEAAGFLRDISPDPYFSPH